VVDGAALEKRCAKAPRVRIPPSPPKTSSDRWRRGPPPRTSEGECQLDDEGAGTLSRGRGRLVDYGAALEMRFGATRRGFESRPLRHLRTPGRRPMPALAPPLLAHGRLSPRVEPHTRFARAPVLGRRLGLDHPPGALRALPESDSCPRGRLRSRSAVDSACRARRGTSGALYLQTAPAGLNSHPRSPFSRAAASSDVEDRVPRSGESRTVSGPEGSSTKRTSSGAAERPGPSRSLRWARKRSGRRWVHGNLLPLARDLTGAL
jgi:hypothetical protein